MRIYNQEVQSYQGPCGGPIRALRSPGPQLTNPFINRWSFQFKTSLGPTCLTYPGCSRLVHNRGSSSAKSSTAGKDSFLGVERMHG